MTTDSVPDGMTELYEALSASQGVGPWVFEAACAGLDLFTSLTPLSDPAHLSAAGWVCAGCYVLSECRSYAERVPTWGVWGGRAWEGDTSTSVMPAEQAA